MSRTHYSIREIALLTGLSKQKIYQMTYAGELSYVRIGTRKLIPVAEFERVFGAGGAL
jgi:excisionase family DNA binding protein